MNLLQPPSHHRLDYDSENDLPLETENVVSNEEKENIPLEPTSPNNITTGITQQQTTHSDSSLEKKLTQHRVTESDDVIENRNIMTSPQNSIVRRRSSSTSSSSSSSSFSSSSSSSNSSTTSSSTSMTDDKNITRPSLDENADPQAGTSKDNVFSPSILTSYCDELPSVRPRTADCNYKISPLHSEESDVDLSDDDPTYIQDLHQRSPGTAAVASIDTNNSTTTDGDINTKRNVRKRKADPTKWMQNTQKIERNLGQSYVAVHSKKLVPARKIKPPCGQKCRFKCSDRINDSKRLEIFNAFWALGDRQLQRMYILSNSTNITPKYKYTNAENPRNPNHAFYFSVDAEKVRVCKTFFINTLDISHKMVRTVQVESKTTGGFINNDQRGKHNKHTTVSDELINDIKDFNLVLLKRTISRILLISN